MQTIVSDPQKIDEILERGTIVQVLPSQDELRKKLLSGKRLKFYIGFDATAPTLHWSHAKNLILLEKFRKLGHEVIILFGDFTARIGDPSDKTSARQPLTRENVVENVRIWKKLISPLMGFDDKVNPARIVYNNDWLSALTFEDVIQLSSNFTVQQILERHMFQKRIQDEKPIFLHEFLYPLMQAYDSVMLDVDFELCGTDQIFNALAGRTLMQRLKNKEKGVVVVTLMENPKTGQLMSKSNGTGVFLHVSPHEMFGQIMSQPDEMIEILLLHCTHISKNDISNILAEPNPRDSKLRLAREMVALLHGMDVAEEAELQFLSIFQKNEIPVTQEVCEISNELHDIVSILVASGLALSKGDARRAIEGGGIRINGIKIMTVEHNCNADPFVLQRGKRKCVQIIRAK